MARESTGKTEIEGEHLILVEGSDDKGVVDAQLKHLNLTGFQVISCNGVKEISSRLRALALGSGWEEVKTVRIIRDADLSAENAFRSCQGAFENAGLPVPPAAGIMHTEHGSSLSVGAFICGVGDKGSLEDLCWLAVQNVPAADCVRDFISCLAKKHSDYATLSEAEFAKIRMQSYIAGIPIARVKSIAVAASVGRLNLEHEIFDPMRQFLHMDL